MGSIENLTGYLLIAETDLGDPNFVETVVLVIHHDDEGAFGLVTNRRSHLSLGEAAPNFAQGPFSALPLYVGGPVEQEYLFALHSVVPGLTGSQHAQQVCTGIIFEPVFSELAENIAASADKASPEIRLMAGYSGWGPQQLEHELQQGAWVVLEASEDLVFQRKSTEGWKNALKKKGGVYWAAAETGVKPSLN